MDATARSASRLQFEMDATHASTPSVSSSTLQLLTSTPPSSEQLCGGSSSKQLCGSTRLVLAELGLARLSKFAHALDLSKLRAGAISAPELRALGLSAALSFVATAAMAQELSPITNMFTTIGDALTGELGRAIGLVALAVVGVMFATGRMNWISAVSVVVGLAIIFGAGTILSGYA